MKQNPAICTGRCAEVQAVFKVLGLEGQPATELTLHFKAGQIATASVERHLTIEEVGELAEVLTIHNLNIGETIISLGIRGRSGKRSSPGFRLGSQGSLGMA